METGDWKELIEVEGMMEAEIIKGKLESEGISVSLQFESAGRIFGITMDGLGKVSILVPADQLKAAQTIVFGSEDR